MAARILGFARRADGSVARVSDWARATEVWSAPDAAVWLDLEFDTQADLEPLRDLLPSDVSLFEDCLTGEPRPRVEDFGGPLLTLMYGARGPDARGPFRGRRQLLLAVGRHLLTIHDEPVRGLGQVRARAERHGDQLLGSGPHLLMARIAEAAAHNYLEVLEDLEARILGLEDLSLEQDRDESLLVNLQGIRRDLLEIRQAAFPHQEVFRLLEDDDEYPQVSRAARRRFSRVADQFAKIVEEADSLRDRLREIRANYESMIANQTNEIVRVLTLMSGLMLPLTLIAGVYGMNVPLWPAADRPSSFWFVLAIMATSACLLFLFFRRKNWL